MWISILLAIVTVPPIISTADTGTFLVDTGIAEVRVWNYQPQVAFDGTNFLVVTVDDRSDLERERGIYGRRVTPSGILLDRYGFCIGDTTGQQARPGVSFGDSLYLATWVDGNSQNSVMGSRVARDGRVLDPQGFVIKRGPNWNTKPALAFCDSVWLVAWINQGKGLGVTRVTSSGRVLDTAGIKLWSDSAAYPRGECDVSSSGSAFLLTWCCGAENASDEMLAARISPDGTVLDGDPIVVSRHPRTSRVRMGPPSVVYGDSEYLAAWTDDRLGTPRPWAARVQTDGSVVDTFGACLSREGLSDSTSRVDAAFDGDNFLVAWEDLHQPIARVHAVRIDRECRVLDRQPLAMPTRGLNEYGPSVAYGDGRYLMVWADNSSWPHYTVGIVGGALVTQDGTIIDTLLPLASAVAAYNNEDMPAGAWYEGKYLVTWASQYRHCYAPEIAYDINGLRLDSAGRRSEAPASVVCGAWRLQTNPTVAAGDSGYMVAWQDARYMNIPLIYGTIVSPEGEVLDVDGKRVDTAAADTAMGDRPVLAFDGARYFAAWARHGRKGIYGARFTQAGQALDPGGFRISPTGMTQEYAPAVAFDGTNYAVTWFHGDTRGPIYAARVDPAGYVMDSAIALPGSGKDPAIAFGGGCYLAVWAQLDNYSGYWRTRGARMAPSGTLLDTAFWISSVDSRHNEAAAVVYDGRDFVVIWQSRWDSSLIEGARVSPQGIVLETFVVPAPTGDKVNPALIRGPGTRLLALWSGWTDSIGGKPDSVMRIWGRFLDFQSRTTSLRNVDQTQLDIAAEPSPFVGHLTVKLGPVVTLQKAKLVIRDVAGRTVRTIPILARAVAWDGRDGSGRDLPAGIYFIAADCPGVVVRPLCIVKTR
jgi:hypothetical protein